ncbi:MAG: ABC transporter permease [Chloroflexi bacterium]|nr:ABC transporter permease [Chloroflexota bacterium]
MLNSLRTIRHKTLRDLWGNLGRTALVALSIAIGVVAVGMIVATQDILTMDIRTRYAAINPAQIEILVPAGVTQDDIDGLQKIPGVVDTQGRAVFNGRYLNVGSTEWKTIEFIVLPEPDVQTINIVTPASGAWYAERGQVVVERASLGVLNAQIGDTIIVDAMGREKSLQIVGTAHQQDDVMASIKGNPIVFIDSNTLVQLQGHDRINTIYLTVNDPAQKSAIANAARDRLERSNYTVSRVTLRDPSKHPAQDVLTVLFLVMGILGVLALVLSSFLVTDTISALIAQQIKQIGVMKAIGADTWLVARAYGSAVLVYGFLGTLLATPIAERAGYQLAKFLAQQINVDLLPYRPSHLAQIVMVAVGLLVPVIAAAKPLWEGARITVRQAIADYGLGGGSGNNALSQWLGKIRNLPRTWALALRNAVRVPDRLALTLITLSLGGAIFIAVLSVDASFANTIDNLIEGQYGMDALIAFKRQQRVSWVVPLVESNPNVAHAEAWYFEQATMKTESGRQVQVLVQAGPNDTEFYQPRLQSGRWLLPTDENAIVINRKWADEEGIQLGDTVQLDLGENYRTTDWVVVGINQDLVQKQTGVFVSFDALDRALKRTDKTITLQVQYKSHDAASQKRDTSDLVAMLKANGIDVFSTQILGDIKNQVTSLYHILVVFLLVMSLLTALVGGIGLMGMMSINVLERSKEIGVMRAIGASNSDIVKIFWGESMVVSLLSFMLAIIVSVPLSRGMARAVGMAFIQSPLDFAYAYIGIGYWLVIVIVVGTLASIAPALNAANLSVRQSLSYE